MHRRRQYFIDHVYSYSKTSRPCIGHFGTRVIECTSSALRSMILFKTFGTCIIIFFTLNKQFPLRNGTICIRANIATVVVPTVCQKGICQTQGQRQTCSDAPSPKGMHPRSNLTGRPVDRHRIKLMQINITQLLTNILWTVSSSCYDH